MVVGVNNGCSGDLLEDGCLDLNLYLEEEDDDDDLYSDSSDSSDEEEKKLRSSNLLNMFECYNTVDFAEKIKDDATIFEVSVNILKYLRDGEKDVDSFRQMVNQVLAHKPFTTALHKECYQTAFIKGILLTYGRETQTHKETIDMLSRIKDDPFFEVAMKGGENDPFFKEAVEGGDRWIVVRTIEIGADRFKTPDVLFNPSLVQVIQSLNGCDADIRRELFSSILLSGGTASMQQLKERLEKDSVEKSPHTARVKVLASGSATERRFRKCGSQSYYFSNTPIIYVAVRACLHDLHLL